MTTISELQKESWRIAEEHGFHAQQVNLPPETLALYLRCFLTIGEIAEAGEELRAGHAPDEIYFEYADWGLTASHPFGVRHLSERVEGGAIKGWTQFYDDLDDVPAEDRHNVVAGKPAGFPIELADALIRLADAAEGCGVDLEAASKMKAAYNETRSFLHGKQA